MSASQAPATLHDTPLFPATRYQGSKRKLAPDIIAQLRPLRFTSVLDAFGGTGAVAHAFKCMGKHVTYNDVLRFNHFIGLALIENDVVKLDERDLSRLLHRHDEVSYETFIEDTFEDIYFTREENRWLDMIQANIRRLDNRFKRALAWYAVFQSAMAKRPYNLFHRKNLYMRTADVERGFGNKVSWDRSFPEHFRHFVAEANAAVVDSGGVCRAVCDDALALEPGFDLVYVDTPYINRSGVGVDYRDFYHFLEGMVHYDKWPEQVDLKSKHRRMIRHHDPWSDPRTCHDMFRRLFEHFSDSILVVSYRSDGIPTIDELVTMLKAVKGNVQVIEGERYQYVLSPKRNTREVLLIGTRE